jgi:hypothetical protein
VELSGTRHATALNHGPAMGCNPTPARLVTRATGTSATAPFGASRSLSGTHCRRVSIRAQPLPVVPWGVCEVARFVGEPPCSLRWTAMAPRGVTRGQPLRRVSAPGLHVPALMHEDPPPGGPHRPSAPAAAGLGGQARWAFTAEAAPPARPPVNRLKSAPATTPAAATPRPKATHPGSGRWSRRRRASWSRRPCSAAFTTCTSARPERQRLAARAVKMLRPNGAPAMNDRRGSVRPRFAGLLAHRLGIATVRRLA